jgi:hypothetical protein
MVSAAAKDQQGAGKRVLPKRAELIWNSQKEQQEG